MEGEVGCWCGSTLLLKRHRALDVAQVDFEHDKEVNCSVKGLARRFWQASPDHRGTPDHPGRVCTLLEADVALELEGVSSPSAEAVDSSEVHGKAFHVPASAGLDVMRGLLFREKAGYAQKLVTVTTEAGDSFEALAFVGTDDNEHFAGYEPPEAVARVIAASHGPSGPNIEYFLKLFVALGPSRRDAHLQAVYDCLKAEHAGALEAAEKALG